MNIPGNNSLKKEINFIKIKKMILRPVHNLLYEEFLVVNNRKYYVDLTASYFFDLMMLHEFLFTNYLFYLKNNESIFIFKTSTSKIFSIFLFNCIISFKSFIPVAFTIFLEFLK